MTDTTLAGLRVMVVEDELLIAMLIEDTLLDQGCVIVGPYTSVNEAALAAQNAAVDLALLDVNLRGEKIYPVAEILSARGIPFLLLSGYGGDAVPADRPDWQAVSKPFVVTELVAKVAALLGRRPDANLAPGGPIHPT
jgi:DNA-binding response OmpR family regulator